MKPIEVFISLGIVWKYNLSMRQWKLTNYMSADRPHLLFVIKHVPWNNKSTLLDPTFAWNFSDFFSGFQFRKKWSTVKMSISFFVSKAAKLTTSSNGVQSCIGILDFWRFCKRLKLSWRIKKYCIMYENTNSQFFQRPSTESFRDTSFHIIPYAQLRIQLSWLVWTLQDSIFKGHFHYLDPFWAPGASNQPLVRM